LRVLENKVIRRIFGPKTGEATDEGKQIQLVIYNMFMYMRKKRNFNTVLVGKYVYRKDHVQY
jgi:hypothetical protein